MTDLSKKLIRVERSINIYKKENELPFLEINIDDIPFEEIKKIVIPKNDDPLLYDGYDLNKNQIDSFNLFLKEKIIPDFKRNNYILVCGGIYDWGIK